MFDTYSVLMKMFIFLSINKLPLTPSNFSSEFVGFVIDTLVIFMLLTLSWRRLSRWIQRFELLQDTCVSGEICDAEKPRTDRLDIASTFVTVPAVIILLPLVC